MKKFAKCLATICLLVSIIVSCNQDEKTIAGCESNEILLEGSFFSSDTVTSPEISPLPEGTRDSIGNTIYLERGIFVQNVFPFSTTRRAESEFKEELRDPVFQAQSTWFIPDILPALDIQAEDYRVACGEQHNIPMCRAILQHGRYFVFVNAHTYEDELSPSDFTVAIQEIDKRIRDCVEHN